MFTAHDLDGFGKRLSTDYTTNKTPLTAGLMKIAQANGLNRQEVNRVAESANTETYLSLIKDSDDKYVNFDLADANDAYAKTVGTEKTASYKDDYESSIKIRDIPLWPEDGNLEKNAETVIDREAIRKEAHRLEGSLHFLEDALFEAKANFESHYTNLENMTKQAVLGGVPFSDTVAVLTSAAPAVAEPISEMFKETLSSRMPHINFDKEAESKGPIDTNSDYYNEGQCLGYYIDRLADLEKTLDYFEERYTEKRAEANMPCMFKRAGIVGIVGETLKDLATMAWKHKYTTGMVVALPMAYKTGKRKGKNEQGVLLQDAMMKIGPERRIKRVFR